MISTVVSGLIVLVFGTLYPAYCSYKAVKSKNVREYVKWMMYWIVFALFTSAETFADIFISWVPFYYEVKVVFVIWLLSPYTQGSSVLYRKFIHPALARRESEIDDMISKAKEQGYSAVLTLGSKAMTSATNLAIQAVSRGPEMLDQLRRSYSSSDVNRVQITELNDDGEPLPYDNDLALVQSNRRPNNNNNNVGRNATDSEDSESRPSREEVERRVELEFARQISRDLSLSRESSASDFSSSSPSSSSSSKNNRNSRPRSYASSSSASASSSSSSSHFTSPPSPPPPPAHSNRMSASLHEAPPLRQEEVLRRFSQLSPETQRRILNSKERSVYAEMVARADLDDRSHKEDDDDDDDVDEDDNRRAEEYEVDGDEEEEEEERMEEETVYYDGEGRRVKTSPKPPRPPPPTRKSRPAPPRPTSGLVKRPSLREDEGEAKLKRRMMTTTTSAAAAAAAGSRPRAPPPPLPADAAAGAGQKLRLTAVPKGVQKRVKPKE